MEFLRQTVNILADLLITLIILRIILSWLVRDQSSILVRFLNEATEPLLNPIRKALPRTGMLDLSPIIAYFLIELIRSLLNQYL